MTDTAELLAKAKRIWPNAEIVYLSDPAPGNRSRNGYVYAEHGSAVLKIIDVDDPLCAIVGALDALLGLKEEP
jgi:hypothetical protein